jgi:EmrB/QacA subfamily drug resistance transporter
MALPCAPASIRASPSAAPCIAQKTWVLTTAVLASTMAFVDESVVNVALPRMETDLHAALAATQWVVNAYTLCMSALLLTGGAAADQYGRRLIFITGVGIFAVASVTCGLAMNVQTLLLARGIQGVGAALLIPCSLALIGAAYDEQERGAAIGVWSGASAIASGLAPLMGGWLVDHWTWRAIFLINPLLAIPTLWIAVTRVPESRNAAATGGIDWLGALLAFLGLGSLVYGLISASDHRWSEATVLVPLLAAVVLLAAFVRAEHVSSAPMVPFDLFRSLRFSGINVLTFLLYGALGAAFFFLPFLLIQARGYSATAAGAVYLPFTLVVGVLSRWSGRLTDRFGARRPLMAGPALTVVGFLMLSISTSYAGTLVSMTLLGFAMAVTITPLTTTLLNAVPPARTGIASGINNAVASTGGLLMIAVLGSVCLMLFNRALDQHLQVAHASDSVRGAVAAARSGFILPALPADLTGDERRLTHQIIADSLATSLRTGLQIAALLSLTSAIAAALTIRDRRGAPADRRRTPGN